MTIVLFCLGAMGTQALWRLEKFQSPELVSPWSTLFQTGAQNQLIFCDASLERLEEYLHSSVSLSDYANRKLLRDLTPLSSDARRAVGLLGGADFTVTTAPSIWVFA